MSAFLSNFSGADVRFRATVVNIQICQALGLVDKLTWEYRSALEDYKTLARDPRNFNKDSSVMFVFKR